MQSSWFAVERLKKRRLAASWALLAVVFAVLTGGWISLRTTGSGRLDWPRAMPHVVGARNAVAYETAKGAFVSYVFPGGVAEALEAARAAYAAAGWREEEIRTADTLVFTKGEHVAAVLVRPDSNAASSTSTLTPRVLVSAVQR